MSFDVVVVFNEVRGNSRDLRVFDFTILSMRLFWSGAFGKVKRYFVIYILVVGGEV